MIFRTPRVRLHQQASPRPSLGQARAVQISYQESDIGAHAPYYLPIVPEIRLLPLRIDRTARTDPREGLIKAGRPRHFPSTASGRASQRDKPARQQTRRQMVMDNSRPVPDNRRDLFLVTACSTRRIEGPARASVTSDGPGSALRRHWTARMPSQFQNRWRGNVSASYRRRLVTLKNN